MKGTAFLIVLLILSFRGIAQSSHVREGNKLFREGKFDEAVERYDKALQENPADLTAMYNRSNALAKKGDKAAAMEGYEKLIQAGKDPRILEKAFYDKGVLHQQQQQLDESILAWMEALKLDPEDTQARENLQKAMREKKQQQEQEEKKQENKQKENKEQEKPKPQESKLNKKQVEQLLKALEQKEKEVQKKMQQKGGSPTRPEKDW